MSTKGLLLAGPVPKRIEAKIKRAGGCWLWTGALDHAGYGKLWSKGRYQRAHRLAYEAWVGPIPEGMQLDHLCRTRHCVNPKHLEPVTGAENTLRGAGFAAVNAAKARCVRGHAFDEANTYINPSGSRVCRECRRVRRDQRKATGGAA